MKLSLLRRTYRAFRIKVLGESPILHETLEEMMTRQREYYDRPEVIARLRAIPATHTFSRATGKLTRINDRDV